jgi:hypothetical protein
VVGADVRIWFARGVCGGVTPRAATHPDKRWGSGGELRIREAVRPQRIGDVRA